VKTPLLALFTGTVVSTAGTAMTVLAIPWFVLHTTGSAAQTALLTAVFIRVHLAREAPKQWSARGHLTELREGYRYLAPSRSWWPARRGCW
jgi:hypothetical protein